MALDEGFDANAMGLALQIPTQNAQVTAIYSLLYVSIANQIYLHLHLGTPNTRHRVQKLATNCHRSQTG